MKYWSLLACASLAWASCSPETSLKLPFSTSGRDIVDRRGGKVLYKGTNWAGHLEAMIPEGLQYASIDDIAGQIAGLGLNSVRLTFAIQLVDEIYSKGHDTSLQDTLVNALGPENGTAILADIIRHNPQLTPNTTRLGVYDAVARGLAARQIILHLDNHVSQAGWCCLPADGNGWWGEKYFDPDNWIRGWSYMAAHGAANWPSFASVGLRNELRSPIVLPSEPVDWYTWDQRMTQAADAVHEAAPGALIFFGGLDSDTTVWPLPTNNTLNGTLGLSDSLKTSHFIPEQKNFTDKIVLEIHKYDDFQFPDTEPCDTWIPKEYVQGFQALNASDPSTRYLFPIVMTEWGYGQDGKGYKTQYAKCLTEFVSQLKFGWMQWAVQGSYYIRQGNQDNDESWGLLNHWWNGTRSPESITGGLDLMKQALE